MTKHPRRTSVSLILGGEVLTKHTGAAGTGTVFPRYKPKKVGLLG